MERPAGLLDARRLFLGTPVLGHGVDLDSHSVEQLLNVGVAVVPPPVKLQRPPIEAAAGQDRA